MKTLITATLVCAVLLGPTPPCVAAEVVPTVEVAAIAALADVVDTPQRLSGQISNRGTQRIDNVRLLVSYGWLWNDDRRSNDTSPGWTEVHTLPGAIEPGQSVSFEVEHERPRPLRDDGQLLLTVKVIGLTQWAFVAP